ncbi:MAG: glycosyltransferase family 2 protein [Nitrososphaerales archaeon]
MNIAVAIVNHNTYTHLKACLETVVPERVHVIVVDNASDDDSPEMVASKFPEVELIRSPNQGFGAGANIAFRHARTPYVLLLNSDTRLQAGAAAALAGYLDAHPQVGMVGPRLVNPDGSLQPSIYPTPSPLADLMRWTSFSAVAAHIPWLRRRYFIAWPHNRAEVVGWVAGAALAIRKEAFDAIGGFDTSFFMYSEEVDLAYSLQKAGWQVHFAPVATVTHFGGASTESYRSEMMARLFTSMHHFYRKHFSQNWQRQLKVMITYFMIRNLVRDRWRLLRARCPTQCDQLAQDVVAWQRVLRVTWSA